MLTKRHMGSGNEIAFFQKYSWRAHVSPMFPKETRNLQETLFPVSVFVFKMQIMLTLHGRELKRKSEHASTCKNFASTRKRALTYFL